MSPRSAAASKLSGADSHPRVAVRSRDGTRAPYRCIVRTDSELNSQLVRQLCDIVAGWTQYDAGALLHIHQSEISRLRRGEYSRFSIARLMRLIAARGFNLELHLKPIARPFAKPRQLPTVSIVRYDDYSRPIP